MRYKKLTFLKVPFDNTYTNVYTFPELSSLAPADIATALINYGFESYVITAEKNRYFRITNGNVIMSVPATYDFIRKFNYVIAQTENPDEYTQFYFVTGYSTLNTGETSTTNINIQFDAYMNNYYAISTVQEKYTQIAGHVNDIVVNSGKIYPKNMYPAHLSSKMIEENIDCGKRILWLELMLDGEGEYYTLIENKYIKTTPISVYSTIKQLPIVIIPVAVFDTKKMEFSHIPGEYQLHTFNNEEYMPIGVQSYSIYGLHVLQAKYTYSCPFSYTEHTDSNGQVYFLMEETSDVKHFSLTNLYVKKPSVSESPTITENDVEPLCRTKISNGSRIDMVLVTSNEFGSQFSTFNANTLLHLQFNNIPRLDYLESKEYDETNIVELNRYPFEYYKIICGNEIFTVYPPEHCEGFDIIDICEGYEHAFKIVYFDANNTKIYETLLHPKYTSGFVPLITKSEDIYTRNTGNSINAQMQLAQLNYIKNSINSNINYLSTRLGAAQTASGDPAKAVSTEISSKANKITDKINNAYSLYSTITTINAKIEDAKNAQDSITNIDSNAIKNALSQDSIIVRKCFIDPSCTELQDYALSIYKNGINTNVSTSLLGSGRAMFFFRKLLSCHIPTITNNDERNEVENIFTEGATFWKLKNYANEADKIAVRTMQKIRNNPEYV